MYQSMLPLMSISKEMLNVSVFFFFIFYADMEYVWLTLCLKQVFVWHFRIFIIRSIDIFMILWITTNVYELIFSILGASLDHKVLCWWLWYNNSDLAAVSKSCSYPCSSSNFGKGYFFFQFMAFRSIIIFSSF